MEFNFPFCARGNNKPVRRYSVDLERRENESCETGSLTSAHSELCVHSILRRHSDVSEEYITSSFRVEDYAKSYAFLMLVLSSGLFFDLEVVPTKRRILSEPIRLYSSQLRL
jgi:hypothetical protein